jgi:DNA-binding response OmpR family regulator
MDSPNILIVDDDPDILRILKDNLELDGYGVSTASTGREALDVFGKTLPALMVLDLSLPDVDGLQICRSIRERSSVPIIILTARDSVPEKVLGLESGADDYLAKPFDYLELAARIRACLRRQRTVDDVSEVLELGRFKVDAPRHSVLKDGKKLHLTRSEFNLLFILARSAGKVLTRRAIRRELRPDAELYDDSRAIDVHVRHLRSKIEDDPGVPAHIITVPGVGYMFSVPGEK